MEGVFSQLLKEVRSLNPQVIDLYHRRTSVIAHWLKEHGLMEAMLMAGHCNIKTTKRYKQKSTMNCKSY